MYRLSYDVGKVGKYMTLKVSCVVQDDEFNPSNKKAFPLFHKFSFQGSNYFNVAAKPYLAIEITNPFVKAEEGNKFDPSRRINLTRYGIFCLSKALSRMIRRFVSIKDLYYYYEGKLMIDANKASEITTSFIMNNKRIILQPNVIEDYETRLIHEGILFCINDNTNFAPLKYSEMEYLYYILEHLDLESVLSMLIQSEGSKLVDMKQQPQNKPKPECRPMNSVPYTPYKS